MTEEEGEGYHENTKTLKLVNYNRGYSFFVDNILRETLKKGDCINNLVVIEPVIFDVDNMCKLFQQYPTVPVYCFTLRSDWNIVEILKFLKNLTFLKNLIISRITSMLSQDECDALSEFLTTTKTLEYFSFSNNDVWQDNNLVENAVNLSFFDALASNVTLTHVSIGPMIISSNFEGLVKLLNTNKRVKHLHLKKFFDVVNLKDDEWTSFCDAVKNCSLNSLSIDNNGLSSKQLNRICESVNVNIGIEKFKLRSCPWPLWIDVYIEVLAKLMTKLKSFVLPYVKLESERHVKILGESIERSVTLKTLNLTLLKTKKKFKSSFEEYVLKNGSITSLPFESYDLDKNRKKYTKYRPMIERNRKNHIATLEACYTLIAIHKRKKTPLLSNVVGKDIVFVIGKHLKQTQPDKLSWSFCKKSYANVLKPFLPPNAIGLK